MLRMEPSKRLTGSLGDCCETRSDFHAQQKPFQAKPLTAPHSDSRTPSTQFILSISRGVIPVGSSKGHKDRFQTGPLNIKVVPFLFFPLASSPFLT
jgi:hypothetical protein